MLVDDDAKRLRNGVGCGNSRSEKKVFFAMAKYIEMEKWVFCMCKGSLVRISASINFSFRFIAQRSRGDVP